MTAAVCFPKPKENSMLHRYFEVNEGGHNIRCKLYYSDLKAISRCVIFCHGFGGHKEIGRAHV